MFLGLRNVLVIFNEFRIEIIEKRVDRFVVKTRRFGRRHDVVSWCATPAGVLNNGSTKSSIPIQKTNPLISVST